MRLCRFGDSRLGIVEGSDVRDVTSVLDVLPSFRYPLPSFDLLIANLDQVTELARGSLADAPAIPVSGVKLLSPVANPGKVIAAPTNYLKHLEEARSNFNKDLPGIHKSGLFLKATSSIGGPGQGIAIAKPDRRNDHEVELVFVIGKKGKNICRSEAMQYVAGYCIGLDITVRGSEDRSLRKSADSYTVLGPWLVTADEISDPGQLNVSISVNGEVRQNSNTNQMIMSVAELIEVASSFYTLYPGDVVFTGTPEGVSALTPGDVIIASIERIGAMEVKVRA